MIQDMCRLYKCKKIFKEKIGKVDWNRTQESVTDVNSEIFALNELYMMEDSEFAKI